MTVLLHIGLVPIPVSSSLSPSRTAYGILASGVPSVQRRVLAESGARTPGAAVGVCALADYGSERVNGGGVVPDAGVEVDEDVVGIGWAV